MQAVARSLGDELVESTAHLGAELRAELGISFSISKRVYQTSRFRIAANSAIRVRYSATVSSTTRSWSASEPAVARGDQHADGEALDIPLPRAGQRLVEVVDVEDEPPLGRARTARSWTGARRREHCTGSRCGECGQVGRHDQRRASIERERRKQHPVVPDRHRAWEQDICLALQERDGVPSTPGGLELRMARARNLTPGGSAPCDVLGHAQMRRARADRVP